MNEIHWKRGIPTEEECRECYLHNGGYSDKPEWCETCDVGSTGSGYWSPLSWYASVRILPPEAANTNGVDPGEGWRLLVQGDTTKEGDEYRASTGEWFKAATVGLHYKTDCFAPMRRKIEPVIREFRNTEGPQPEPFQWWGRGESRVYICGRTDDGKLITRSRSGGTLSWGMDLSRWTHLKDCTGWEWEPEPPKKKQRKWVNIKEQWEDEGSIVHGWTRTDETREVPR